MFAEPIAIRGSVTQDTLRLMQRLIDQWAKHPFMVQVSREICANAGARTPLEEARAIWQWVKARVAYRLDPVGAEWVQDPFETIANSAAGDCDDMAVACATLLQAIGHPCKAAAVWWENRDEFTHAVCWDQMTGIVDAVADSFEWPPEGVRVRAVMEAP